MKFRKLLNILLPIIILYEYYIMFFYGDGTMLGVGEIKSLRYFTVLSNLFEALACIAWLFTSNEHIKYYATFAIMITFTVVMGFLGPLFGYSLMFQGPNLYFHLIVPLAALFENLFSCEHQINKER